ncbi:MAG: helix-turn-helix domain-containing protein, partial [Fimbriimonadaceae bacterium]
QAALEICFAQGLALADIAQRVGLRPTTVAGYLATWIQENRPDDISCWVTNEVYERVKGALSASEDGRLKPIHEALNEEVPYEQIRFVKAHAEGLMEAEPAALG